MAFGDLQNTLSQSVGNQNSARDFFLGSESKMNPYNQNALQQLIEMLQGGGLEGNNLFGGATNFLQQLFSNQPGFYENFERPFYENFQQNIAPGLANTFAGFGTGAGGLNSSGFQNSLAQAGRGLQTDLAAMRGQMQLQGLSPALQYAQQPVANKLNAAQNIPNQYYETPGQPGLVQTAAKAAIKAGINAAIPGSGGI
jgi:hypothetical protein